jgi:limonene-1,2-epoxide hydrolase
VKPHHDHDAHARRRDAASVIRMARGARPGQQPEMTGIEIVESFFAASQAMDMERAFAFFADDVVYQNVPLPPDRGRAAVERTLRRFTRVATYFEVRMHHIAEHDGVVLTERTDILRGPLIDLEFWCDGTFEIRDGKIAVWRDRFDVGLVTAQLLASPMRKIARRAGMLR